MSAAALALVITASLALASPVGATEDPAAAKALFDEGTKLYDLLYRAVRWTGSKLRRIFFRPNNQTYRSDSQPVDQTRRDPHGLYRVVHKAFVLTATDVAGSPHAEDTERSHGAAPSGPSPSPG